MANQEPANRTRDYPDLFERLDLDRPELSAVKAAVENRDWPTAEKALADFYREQLPRSYRERRSSPGEDYWVQASREIADHALAHELGTSGGWVDAGTPIDWRINPTVGEEYTIEVTSSLNRHSWFLALSEAYLQTGEERYVREIIDQMIDWTRTWPRPETHGDWSNFAGPDETTQDLWDRVCAGWNTLHPADQSLWYWSPAFWRIIGCPCITDQEICAVIWSFSEKALFLDDLPPRMGNKAAREQAGLYTIGTLFAEFRLAAQWRQNAIARLYKQIVELFYPDGVFIGLGVGYGIKMMAAYVQVLELARLNGRTGELPTDWLERMAKMYEYQAYAMMPNGIIPCRNDSHDVVSVVGSGAALFPEREDFRWFATDGEEGTAPQQTSLAFPYGGQYVMRSGWDLDDRYMLFDGGPLGAEHTHPDKLGMVIYAYGKKLLLDAGNYYYDSSRWRRYATSTRGHNTVRVDGKDQNDSLAVLPKPYQPLDNPWVSEPDFDYVKASYTAGYGQNHEVKSSHTRAILLVKPNYWIVVDWVRPEDGTEHDFESLWHIGAESAQIARESLAVISTDTGSANLQLWPVADCHLGVEIVRGRTQEPVQGWAFVGTPHTPGYGWQAVPTAVYTWRSAQPAVIATVVYPLAPGQQSPIREVVRRQVLLADGEDAPGAIGLDIAFADGTTHQFLWADEPGVMREVGGVTTRDAVLFRAFDPSGKEVRRFSVQ